MPQLLVPAAEMPLVLKCACVGLKVEHKEANYAVLSFLEVRRVAPPVLLCCCCCC